MRAGASAILEGLNPAHEIDFALAMGKLMTVHFEWEDSGMEKVFGGTVFRFFGLIHDKYLIDRRLI